MKQLNPGDTLKNGAIVLEHFENGNKSKVLAMNPGAFQPFVFWNIDADGNTTNGSYFTDLATAVCEFEAAAQY